MAFPYVHLCVAYRALERRPLSEHEAALFMLGSVAPDAVHYRPAFQGAGMAGIGAAKKITHLCPVSDEPWGAVTDNDGWIRRVRGFLGARPPEPFAAGYTVHVLTDIFNNLTLWHNFRTKHPAEAAKGYTSGYYQDLKSIDTRLYHELPEAPRVMALLSKGAAAGVPGIGRLPVTAQEISAIQNNLLREHFKNAAPAGREYSYVSYADMLDFIRDAAAFSIDSLAGQ